MRNLGLYVFQVLFLSLVGEVFCQQVRLRDGSYSSGRLEVFYNGTWGTVCDDFWDMADTHVACRQLGFPSGLLDIKGGHRQGSGQIWLDEVQCTGNETSIQQCSHRGWGSHNCGHNEDIFISCTAVPLSVQSNCNYTTINSYSGRITSPNYPSNYGNYESCYWLVTSYNGSIHLSFENFETESCCDYVQVYNGSSRLSPLLGRFSGNTIPNVLWSSSNQMYIIFNSDYSATTSGFSAVYKGGQGYCVSPRCYNGGTCRDTPSSYYCSCPYGYSGRHCETTICNYYTCRNGGTCQITPTGYNCTCPPRYTGQHCESRDYCISSPCYNGGTCRSGYYGYYCSCPYGYSGSQCEIRMCDYNTCRNGGTCRNYYNSYHCYCPPGYSGRHCENSVGCRNNNPCRNGGTCHQTFYGYIYCSCPRGYSGQHCETNLRTKVTCDTRYMEVELRRAFFPNLEWRNLHLSDPACRATRVTWSTIRLRTTLDGCGTNHTESNDMLEFSNEVKDDKSHLSLNQSVITRDSNTLLRFHCKYSRRQLVSTSFSPSKQTVHVSEGNFGNFTFTMNLFRSATYNNMYLPFEYPVVVSLNQPLWIQFKVTDATTADLVVFADYCHATTSTNPNSLPRYEFVRSGCKLDSTMAYNYDPTSSVQDFSIKSFRFIHTSNKLVYLHCELMACHRNSTNSRCSRGCISSRRRRRSGEDEEDTSEAYDLSVGPFLGESSGNGNSKATDDTQKTNAAMATGLGVVGSLLVLVCAVLVATKLYPWYKTRYSSPDVTVNSYENGFPADIDEKHEACEMQVKT